MPERKHLIFRDLPLVISWKIYPKWFAGGRYAELIEDIVEGNELFSRKLFSELRKPPASNLVFSPFSASTVSEHFALLYLFVIWDLEYEDDSSSNVISGCQDIKSAQIANNDQAKIQGGFFNWPSPEFAKCWPVSNWFQKNVRVPDWPPPVIEKRLSVWRSEYDYNTKKIQGGASPSKFGGGQSRDIFRGVPVKKITLYYCTQALPSVALEKCRVLSMFKKRRCLQADQWRQVNFKAISLKSAIIRHLEHPDGLTLCAASGPQRCGSLTLCSSIQSTTSSTSLWPGECLLARSADEEGSVWRRLFPLNYFYLWIQVGTCIQCNTNSCYIGFSPACP